MHCATKVSKDLYSFQLIKLDEELNSIEGVEIDLFSEYNFIKQTTLTNAHIRHYLIKIKSEANVLGYLYFQAMPFKGKELSAYLPQNQECFLNRTVEKVVDIALDRINWNLMVLGNVFITGDNGQYWKTEVENVAKWNLIRKAINFIASQISADAFLISNLNEQEIKGYQIMLDQGYRFFEVEPDLIFDIDPSWQKFDDYLQSLVSKYRTRTKKVFKNSRTLQIKDLSIEEIKAHQSKLFQLYKNVVDKSQFKLAEISKNYLLNFKEAYPSKFSIRGIFINSKLESFVSFFEDEKNLHINFVGLNYEYNKEYSIYHRILYDCIEQGILLKKEKINFGRTASEIKTSVGALPIKSFSLLKHSSTLPNLAIKPLVTYLKPEVFEVRNPFGKQ